MQISARSLEWLKPENIARTTLSLFSRFVVLIVPNDGGALPARSATRYHQLEIPSGEGSIRSLCKGFANLVSRASSEAPEEGVEANLTIPSRSMTSPTRKMLANCQTKPRLCNWRLIVHNQCLCGLKPNLVPQKSAGLSRRSPRVTPDSFWRPESFRSPAALRTKTPGMSALKLTLLCQQNYGQEAQTHG
jgi:hypothetical protein